MDRDPGSPEPGEYEIKEPPVHFLQEASFAEQAAPRLRASEGAGDSPPHVARNEGRKVKTSVYLERTDIDRLAWLAEVERRPQAEVIREAIRAYWPRPRERHFHLFDSGEGDGRSMADMSEEELAELMANFGADTFGDGDH